MESYEIEDLEEFNPITGDIERFEAFYLNQPTIWVPPSIELKDVEFENVGKELCLVYSFSPPRHPSLGPGSYLYDNLIKNNWRQKEKSKELIPEFCGLAENNITPEAVRDFALKWGPLWICYIHTDWEGFRVPCIWSPSRLTPHSDSCDWRPIEPVADFIKTAKTINAIIGIAMKLVYEEEVPKSLWIEIFGEKDLLVSSLVKTKAAGQKEYLASMISNVMYYSGSGVLFCDWNNGNKPSLKFDAGWGFYRAVLVDLAGLITGGYTMIARCDNCGRWILPGERRRAPKKGQNTFCPDCKNARVGFSNRGKKRIQG